MAIEVQEGEIQKDTLRRAEAVVIDHTPPRDCDLASGCEATRRVQDRTARLVRWNCLLYTSDAADE